MDQSKAKPLRILILEDVPSDADLMERELRKGRIPFTSKRVETRDSFLKQLKDFAPDLLLSDYVLPEFDGMDALRLMKELAPRVPVIIATGSINEEIAVECMKAGAADYVLKEHLSRLAPAVIAALEKNRLQQEKDRAEQKLHESEQKYRSLFEESKDVVFISTPDGKFVDINPAGVELFGYSSKEEILKIDLARELYVQPKDRSSFEQELDRQGFVRDIELELRRKDGQKLVIQETVNVMRDDRGNIVAYRGIMRDVTKRKRADRELRASREKLRELSARLQSVREEEKSSIAREIHDELGQALTGLKMDLSWLRHRLYPGYSSRSQKSTRRGDRNAVLEKTRSMSKLIDSTIKTVQRITTELRPAVLDDLGLIAALEWQAQEFQTRTGIRCNISSSLAELDSQKDVATAIFRIFQESLTNVSRHAHATNVHVSLSQKDRDLVLELQDNGRGISDSEIASANSLGLVGIRERAILLGGEVMIQGVPRIGTTVTVRVPIERS